MRTIEMLNSALKPESRSADRSGSPSTSAAQIADDDDAAIVFVIDNNAGSGECLRQMLSARAFEAQVFSDTQTFLTSHQSGRRGCVLVDVSTPGAGGIAFIRQLYANACGLPVIAMATRFAPARVVEAMKAGASDCLDRPVTDEVLLSTIERAIEEADKVVDAADFRSLAIERVATLTARQHEILELIAAGHPSKNIAADLKISQRTVENHRAAIARKTCSRSLSAVVRTAMCANCSLMKARH